MHVLSSGASIPKVRFPPWPGIFFKLVRCGYTLRVTSQTFSSMLSPEFVSSAIVLSLLLKEFSNDPWSLHNKPAVFSLLPEVAYMLVLVLSSLLKWS
jgi:hypothetical protein